MTLKSQVNNILNHLPDLLKNKCNLSIFSNGLLSAEYDLDLVDSRIKSSTLYGYVKLETSGTTGAPKIIHKHMPTLFANKKGVGSKDDVWLLTYSPTRWAGISVILHCFKNNSTLIVPEDLSPQSLLKALEENNITHISLTPSLFRKLCLLNKDVLANANIKQVTFGGEYTTQKVLDEARGLWNLAKITHIYASTELGDICAVSDGLEGIPIDKLKTNLINGFYLAENGELFINENSTEDTWELKDNRLYFKGRLQEIVNVGGAKVSLSYVENIVNGIEHVFQSKAYKMSNQFLGEAVGLEYVGNIDAFQLRVILKDLLPKYAIPIKISKVDFIELTDAGKVSRK